ncbi:hypothetical protein SAMN05443573_1202 [Celeribacter indicus]|uniref:Uncharacterized protein n=1 Tax=Celeribacter indicus TaxID=1208324 RepID=A0A0B5E831_9RHOB|nr:hypothetical protein P73_3757 [Celeribacter indicus]SDX28571.1 hypothetical protein SAMN05443573_1202 [Celeribacter indicus]
MLRPGDFGTTPEFLASEGAGQLMRHDRLSPDHMYGMAVIPVLAACPIHMRNICVRRKNAQMASTIIVVFPISEGVVRFVQRDLLPVQITGARRHPG